MLEDMYVCRNVNNKSQFLSMVNNKVFWANSLSGAFVFDSPMEADNFAYNGSDFLLAHNTKVEIKKIADLD